MYYILNSRYEPPWHKNGIDLTREIFPTTLVEKYMNDPTWVKAIFFRDPSTRLVKNKLYDFGSIFNDGCRFRLLSAYLHLIKNPLTQRNYPRQLRRFNLSGNWEDFYESAISLNGIKNLHWRPQVNRNSCPGRPSDEPIICLICTKMNQMYTLDSTINFTSLSTAYAQTDFCGFHKFHSLFNFVGNMEHVKEHGEMLLRRVGIYETYGANGWSLSSIIKTPKGTYDPHRYKFKLPKVNSSATHPSLVVSWQPCVFIPPPLHQLPSTSI